MDFKFFLVTNMNNQMKIFWVDPDEIRKLNCHLEQVLLLADLNFVGMLEISPHIDVILKHFLWDSTRCNLWQCLCLHSL